MQPLTLPALPPVRSACCDHQVVSDRIRPAFFYPPTHLQKAGLDLHLFPKDARLTGVHVLFGRNNVGKSRVLDALREGLYGATVGLDEIIRHLGHPPNNVSTRDVGSVTLNWARPNQPADSHQSSHLPEQEGAALQARIDPTRYPAIKSWLEGAGSHLGGRPAAFLGTNRYLVHSGTTAKAGNEPAGWAGLLHNLANSTVPARVEQFDRISAAFEVVTEGLRFRARGESGAAEVFICDGPGDKLGRTLRECGDGLRDLLGLLIQISHHDGFDLLIDDPGIRLHPHAQRRILDYLVQESKDRAIWVATHDGVFIGSPAVQTRIAVHRERDVTMLSEPTGYEETRRAFIDLGWQPNDAFFADTVLFCEGPSDLAAFRIRLSHLSRTAPLMSGTHVVPLRGTSDITADQPRVREHLELAHSMFPQARLVAVMDRDRLTEPQIAALRLDLEKKGLAVHLHVLAEQELEGYWLDARVIVPMLLRVAERAGRTLVVEPAEVVAMINKGQSAMPATKPSAILSEIWNRYLAGPYPKTDGAEVAVALLGAFPDLSDRLDLEIRKAVEHAR